MKRVIDRLRMWQLEWRRFTQNGEMKEREWKELYALRDIFLETEVPHNLPKSKQDGMPHPYTNPEAVFGGAPISDLTKY